MAKRKKVKAKKKGDGGGKRLNAIIDRLDNLEGQMESCLIRIRQLEADPPAPKPEGEEENHHEETDPPRPPQVS